jgi:ribose transport system permease protein
MGEGDVPQRVSREGLIKFAPVLVLLALIVLFSLINPNFLSLRNAGRIAIAATPALMVAVGVTFIILMGSIDLAMEGTVAVAAVVFGYVFIWAGGTLAEGWWAIPLALAVGAAMGLVNGLAHVRLRIPSFMASLALGFVGIGLSLVMTGGDRIRVEDEAFRTLLKVRWLGFPVMCYVALFFLLVAWFIQSRTTIGRNFYAVGGGEDLAQASGLNVGRVRVIGFTLAGIFYAIGAILAVARIGIAETQTGLAQFMFVSITAVVVGGTALWGGVGGVWNTLVGVLIVFTISNGMTVIGLPDYLQDGILGLLVIIAVVLSTDRRAIAFVK